MPGRIHMAGKSHMVGGVKGRIVLRQVMLRKFLSASAQYDQEQIVPCL